MPSFTCPNNMSIVTGCPASVHGISGNFYLDPRNRRAGGDDRPRTAQGPFGDERILAPRGTGRVDHRPRTSCAGSSRRAWTSPAARSASPPSMRTGARWRRTGSKTRSASSAGRCRTCTRPSSRSSCSTRAQAAGGAPPDILYLSLTDYIQHAHAPGEPEADRFYAELDARFGRFEEMGATVALTADHGMNEKTNDDGTPRVVWLQDLLDEEFGEGARHRRLPITDAFVGHHGARRFRAGVLPRRGCPAIE